MDILEGYKQVEKLLPWNVEHAVLNGEVNVTWINDTCFYYAKEERKDGSSSKVVDKENA